MDRSHVEVAVDVRTGRPADASTPPQYIQPQMIWPLPPEYAAWARENNVPQLAQPGVPQETTRKGNAPLLPRAPAPLLSLTSPDPNRVYTLDPGLPASAQQIPLTALPGGELASTAGPITLLADGEPLAIVAAPDYTAWSAVDGRAAYVPAPSRHGRMGARSRANR